MSNSATLTVTLTPEVAGKLAEIAAHQHRTPDAVVAGAVADMIDREDEIVAAIERGRADHVAGRVFSQAEVMRDVQAIIDAARATG